MILHGIITLVSCRELMPILKSRSSRHRTRHCRFPTDMGYNLVALLFRSRVRKSSYKKTQHLEMFQQRFLLCINLSQRLHGYRSQHQFNHPHQFPPLQQFNNSILNKANLSLILSQFSDEKSDFFEQNIKSLVIFYFVLLKILIPPPHFFIPLRVSC